MLHLSGTSIRRIMRRKRLTIRGIAQQWNLTQTRVRYVRKHGVTGYAYCRDWLQILGVEVAE